jgi:hypothetical protein
MKKTLSLLFILSVLVAPHLALSSTFGSMGSMMVGITDTGTVTQTAVSTAFNFGVAGSTMVGVHFIAERDQTLGSLTMYVYCTAVTGTPSNSIAVLYDTAAQFANDVNRPNSTATATSTNTDMSGCASQQWVTYSFTNVTLISGQSYFIGITNTTATPASNNFSITTRGAIDSALGCASTAPLCERRFETFTTTDGFTTDPTVTSVGYASFILKYNDGTLVGNPFVVAAQTPANNANMRGFRVTFDEDVNVIGLGLTGLNGDADAKAYAIYNGAVQVASSSLDRYAYSLSSATMFSSAVTLSGGVTYDFVMEGIGGNIATTGGIYAIGNNPPADVVAVNDKFTYVTGASAGSLTSTTTAIWAGWVLLDTNPAITGGGGGGGSPAVPSIWGF